MQTDKKGEMKMINISLLGSTGSIGKQTLEIVEDNDDINVVALSAGYNIDLLEQQVRKFKPQIVSISTEELAKDLKARLADVDVKVTYGMDGLCECATADNAQIVVTAVVEMMGIRPTVEAIKAKKDIALANKETLVTAGHIIMNLAKEYGVKILPVDSEHSAIFQSMNGENRSQVNKILLTASGGPFRGKTKEYLENVTLEQALNHPNWSMGRKITIDSATMVNKGLEVMEAGWLFDIDLDKIEVYVHPQSIVHSAVEYADGAVIAQLGTPDMKLPIQYALYYPDRRPINSKKLNLFEIGSLTFEKPDTNVFTGLAMAYKAGSIGGSMPTVFNAANEKAVALFLDGKIRFMDITEIISECMSKHDVIKSPDLDDILNCEQWTYDIIDKEILTSIR